MLNESTEFYCMLFKGITYLFYFILQKFNGFLRNDASDDATPVIRILEKVDGHLKRKGTRFMVDDTLHRADCHLLPWLQHIRVAGKVLVILHFVTICLYAKV